MKVTMNWEEHARKWNTWWAGETERPMVVIQAAELDLPLKVPAAGHWSINETLGQSAELILRRYEAHLQQYHFPGDGWPRYWPDFGPGIVAAFLGAAVNSTPDTVWFGAPPYPDLADINLHLDEANIWWRRVRDLTVAAVARWGPVVQIGYTDLGGNLDILASLRGTQNLLMDMIDTPELVAEKVTALTPIVTHYFNALEKLLSIKAYGRSSWAQLWAPGPTYMLQSDISYMISPDMFARFVIPDLHFWCDHIPYPFYHLDGPGQLRHIDQLLSLKKLRGIQWVPGDGAPPAEEWLPLLKRIREGGKLCQIYVTARGAETIVRELGGRGFAFCLTERLSPSEATAFQKHLSNL